MSDSQTLIVGDIQGCYGGLMALLEKAHFDEKRDRLIAVGDLIARGEDSYATIKYLMDLGDRFNTVLGNHDLHFLAVSQGIKSAKKSDRLGPLLASKKLKDVIDWYRQFPLALALDETTTIVHAGLYPKWSPQTLLSLSNEVSTVLKGDKWCALLKEMYGNSPTEWKEALKGTPRLRFIINACTRMRFLQKKSHLEFACKSHPEDAPSSVTPWFEVENASLAASERIVFGHWAALEGVTGNNQFVALDTGYVWGNSLTAMRIPSNTLINVTP